MKSPLKTSQIRSVTIRWRNCFSGMLGRESFYFVTDVSGQPIGPIFKSEAVRAQVALPHD